MFISCLLTYVALIIENREMQTRDYRIDITAHELAVAAVNECIVKSHTQKIK